MIIRKILKFCKCTPAPSFARLCLKQGVYLLVEMISLRYFFSTFLPLLTRMPFLFELTFWP